MQRLLIAGSAGLVLLLLLAGAASAATLTVANTNDSGSGSLRATIASAHAGDTVVLPAKAAHYQVTSGEIPIGVAPLTIQGAGPSSSVIDATGGASRVFEINAAPAATSTVTFQGVTITGGRDTVAPGGGGISVDFVSNTIAVDLDLVNTSVTGNSASVSSSPCCLGGGGIYSNGGTVTLTNSTVSGNTAALTTTQCCSGGGGIYDNDLGVTLVNSSVTNNSATVTSGQCCDGGGGVYGDGSSVKSPIVVTGSQVSGNGFTLNGGSTDATAGCCSGGGGLYQDSSTGVAVSSSSLNDNTAAINSAECCHGGGALFMDVSSVSGTGLAVSGSTVDGNTTTVSGPAGANSNVHCCSGGGAVNGFGFVTVSGSTLDSNTSNVTAGDCCQGGGAVNMDGRQPLSVSGATISNNRSLVSGGSESGGGAVYEDQSGTGSNTYTNSTISGNSTNVQGLVAKGGGGLYEHLAGATGPDVLANVTLAGNSAPSGLGGGIYNFGSKLDAKDSIVALNSAGVSADCYGVANGAQMPTFTSLGYNLTDSPDTCSFSGTGDKVVPAGSVGLEPLAANGGPTQTRALLAGSPAVDAGNPGGCTDAAGHLLTTDQRGFPRPDSGEPRCDIGAYESQPPPTCTLKAKSHKVLLHPRKRKRRLKDRLQLTVKCDQGATVKLTGQLIRKKGKHKKTFKLHASKSVTAGKTLTILLKLPAEALSPKFKDPVKLKLSATNVNGVGKAKLKIAKLKLKTR